MQDKLSIIIPTLNEEAYLARTIDHLLKSASKPNDVELLIVDSGSSDNTTDSIKDYPVKLFVRPEFVLKKYESLNFGIKQAKGKILIFLDADTLLPDRFDELVRSSLVQKEVVGGAFEFAFQSADFKLKLISFFNRIRYRIDRRFYGDQAVYCRAEAAREVGGFPENQLMDAAFFCRHLSRKGKLRLIKKPIRTSPRRFIENGFRKTLWFDFKMLIRFYLNRTTDDQRDEYWGYSLSSGDQRPNKKEFL